jgi:exodeoxyribonuclease VII small subunit
MNVVPERRVGIQPTEASRIGAGEPFGARHVHTRYTPAYAGAAATSAATVSTAPSHMRPCIAAHHRESVRAPRSLDGVDETLTYEAAGARLEAIIARLDSGEAGLRETLELCREGRTLVEFCAAELEAVGQGLEELRLDELVARLEAGRGGAEG